MKSGWVYNDGVENVGKNTPQRTATDCNILRNIATFSTEVQYRIVENDDGIEDVGNGTHCITLQHTATHCKILQHTATHCNTLQHTATHCNTSQHTATHCNTLQGTAVHCNTLNTLQHSAALYSSLQHNCISPQHTPTANDDGAEEVGPVSRRTSQYINIHIYTYYIYIYIYIYVQGVSLVGTCGTDCNSGCNTHLQRRWQKRKIWDCQQKNIKINI